MDQSERRNVNHHPILTRRIHSPFSDRDVGKTVVRKANTVRPMISHSSIDSDCCYSCCVDGRRLKNLREWTSLSLEQLKIPRDWRRIVRRHRELSRPRDSVCRVADDDRRNHCCSIDCNSSSDDKVVGTHQLIDSVEHRRREVPVIYAEKRSDHVSWLVRHLPFLRFPGMLNRTWASSSKRRILLRALGTGCSILMFLRLGCSTSVMFGVVQLDNDRGLSRRTSGISFALALFIMTLFLAGMFPILNGWFGELLL